MRLLLAATLALAFLEPSRERLAISTEPPHAVMAGKDVHVRCRVPRRSDNRWVDGGIRDYRSSRNPIDGEDGPVFHDFFVTRVPCGVEVAFCQVGTNRGSAEVALTPLTVVGCESAISYRR